MNTAKIQIEGIYRHYKGKLYKVHQKVRHSETLEELIFYESLEDNPLGRFWVRPLSMFLEPVQFENRTVPRFSLVDPLIQERAPQR